MTWPPFAETLGILSATIMPIWNIPLIINIVKRKSSKDISLAWVSGVEICVLGMLPSALLSTDLVFKLFGIVNSILFSCVFIAVWIYRK